MSDDRIRSDDAELLSVVDNKDEVVSPGRRDDIHRLGLRHRAAHILVFNLCEQFFMQKRGLHKDNNAGLWDSSVAGHVDHGESYDQCCVREIAEEIGLKIDYVPEKLFKIDACPATGMEFSWVYRLITGQTIKPNYTEMETAEWCDPKVVDNWLLEKPADFASGFRKIWPQYRSNHCPELSIYSCS